MTYSCFRSRKISTSTSSMTTITVVLTILTMMICNSSNNTPMSVAALTSCTDSTESFALTKNGRLKTCAWAGRKPSKTIRRCRKDPTKEMCPETCSNPLCFPTASPTDPRPTVTPPCIDDETFTFRLDNNNLANCRWLKDNNPEVRKAKYCPRGHVKGSCKLSCDFCPCQDDTEFSFQLNNGNTVKCDWLLKNSNPLTDQLRVSTYCFDDAEQTKSSAVGDGCTESCGFCYIGPTPPPVTPPPTPNPTTADSTPSSSPTRPPSPLPSPFPTLRPTSIPSDSPSERPSSEPSVQPSLLPSDEPSRMPSDEPSLEPSRMPSDEPSRDPSRMPSDEPSRRPSDEPSRSPTIP